VQVPRALRVVIIGAGVGGIAAAVELRAHGFTEITLLDRADGVGGTWRYNTYPGCVCDVPSHLYSYSFAQRRDWSRLCSPQPEILEYLEGVAREHDVERLVVPNVDVTSCEWDDERCEWTIRSSDGRSWVCDALIVATGQLHQPSLPRLEGAEEFAGHSFHSARWDHEYSLDGRNVAVIGTGASAIQFIPEVAEKAGRLYVFQRTGNWFLPRRNRPYPAWFKAIIRYIPGLQAFRRVFVYYYAESLTMMIRNPRTWGRIGRLNSTLFMRSQLKDPEVRRKAWPDYTFGCKRILFSSEYLPALQRPNVELVTDRVARLTPTGIVTDDGRELPVDCIINATGFRTTEFMFPMEIAGSGGRTLSEAWANGPHAHLGITVPGFPSLFLMYGPNTNTSGGSIIFYEEQQAAYIRQALELVRGRSAGGIEIREDVEAASDRELQARFEGTAWVACDSWYRDRTGRIVANWPGYMREYAERVYKIDPAEYRILPAPAREPEPEPIAA
jgi:cation diffusion facilitator CzcD-associated flavoprotein CzcO